jgi:elongation factor Ts
LKAAKWLEEQAQKEGWVKADKLKDRKTSQGLLGFLTSNESLTVVELNCETDFVAKSDKFHSLLHTITDSLSSNLETTKDKVKSKFLR